MGSRNMFLIVQRTTQVLLVLVLQVGLVLNNGLFLRSVCFSAS